MARPREFDGNVVLARAMGLFWAKGYDGTSLDELDKATGLNRGSLYNAFGDKRGLYLAVLDHYGRSEIAAGVRLLENSGPATKALAKLFFGVAEAVEAGAGRHGCLLCNAAVERAPHDPEVEARVIANYVPLRRAMAALLDDRGGAGRRQTQHLVDGLFASYLGLYVMAKAGYPAGHLRAAARQALAALEPDEGSR